MAMLEDKDDGLDAVFDKIESKKYWVLVTDCVELLETIENKFYKPKTKANTDFELTFVPGLVSLGLVSVALAHKRRMDFMQLRGQYGHFWMRGLCLS